jgi:hypothetical protein
MTTWLREELCDHVAPRSESALPFHESIVSLVRRICASLLTDNPCASSMPACGLAFLRTSRRDLHGCFHRRADALFDLVDAWLAAEPATPLPHRWFQPRTALTRSGLGQRERSLEERGRW